MEFDSNPSNVQYIPPPQKMAQFSDSYELAMYVAFQSHRAHKTMQFSHRSSQYVLNVLDIFHRSSQYVLNVLNIFLWLCRPIELMLPVAVVQPLDS